MRGHESIIQRYRDVGARVLVVENPYLPNANEKMFAIALDGHNGTGRWPIGDRPRYDIPLEDWHSGGDHVLVLLQRGIGQIGVAMPLGWPKEIAGWLKRHTDRPIIVRRHPAGRPQPLEPHLKKCWAAITWGSGAACKAIAAGVPAFYALPRWIGRAAAIQIDDMADIEQPYRGQRNDFVKAISWAQWTLAEVEDGKAFEAVLQCAA